MRRLILSVLLVSLAATAQAHHPDKEQQWVHPRIDVIGPLGARLPMSKRRKYNRPTKIGGKVAYYIAPSSQEAMAWHDATHRGLYKNHRPRIVVQYFYPKPWEALRLGPRPDTGSELGEEYQRENDGAVEELVSPLTHEPIMMDSELIEQ